MSYTCIDSVYAKNLSYQIDLNQQIKQLNQIYDAHSQCLIQLQQQLSENQNDIDILRGYIQDIQHHIFEITRSQQESCKKLQEIMNQYNDTQYSKNNTQRSLSEPIDYTTYANDLINTNMVNHMDSDYKSAVALVLEKKQYHQAIHAFKNFIKNYPKSDYQPNAHYWLGQLYYNQGVKHDASYHFAWVVKNYPKSPKAPDALLKIGIIMQETHQQEKAKTIYRQIGKLYPNSDAAKQAQKRLIRL